MCELLVELEYDEMGFFCFFCGDAGIRMGGISAATLWMNKLVVPSLR